jgi:YEATS family
VDLKRVLGAIVARVERGDTLEAGTSGVKLAASSGVPHTAPAVTDEGPPHALYLLHRARRDSTADRDGRDYYRLRIWLDGDDAEEVAQVARVTYHLHPSFEDSERVSVDAVSRFEIKTSAWGHFMLMASIEFHSQRAPLVVERYLDF